MGTALESITPRGQQPPNSSPERGLRPSNPQPSFMDELDLEKKTFNLKQQKSWKPQRFPFLQFRSSKPTFTPLGLQVNKKNVPTYEP